MEATVVSSPYSGSFCELNCLVVLLSSLVANSLQPLDSPWPWGCRYCRKKRCGPWTQLPLGDLLRSVHIRTVYNRPTDWRSISRSRRGHSAWAFFILSCQINSCAQISSLPRTLLLQSPDGHERYQDIAPGVRQYLQNENSLYPDITGACHDKIYEKRESRGD
jgi:hypothetical protein